jgi:regulator of sigma E protease
MTTLLAFLLTLAVLIVVHEWGHYRVARYFGVKVLRFSVGFGRVVWRRQRSPDDTEFVIGALPLGGYVRMLDERDGKVAPHEREQAFNRKPLRQRALIVAAGPAANFVLAVVLYAAAHWIGIDEPKAVLGTPPPASLADRAGLRAGDWVREWSDDGQRWHAVRSLTGLRWQLTQSTLRGQDLHLRVSDRDGLGLRELRLELGGLGAGDIDAGLMRRIGLGAPFAEATIGQVRPAGPAAQAGLREGDRVLRVDGVPVADAAALRHRIADAVRDGRAQTLQWQIERDGRLLLLAVTPRVVTDGAVTAGRIDAFIGAPPQLVSVRHGPLEGLYEGMLRTWEVSVLTLRMLGAMLVGEASLSNLSGPLTIADVAGQTVTQGLAYYLGFLALVSVSLGVLNLLPLPMLDGGHLMYYLYEGVTGRPVPEVWLERLQRVGVLILLMVMALALSNDVARLLGLH